MIKDIITLASEILRIIRGYYEQLNAQQTGQHRRNEKTLETYNLPRLNPEEIENMNRPIFY